MAQLRESVEKFARIHDPGGQKARRLVRRIPEHHALVPRALLQARGGRNAAGDIRRLPVQKVQILERIVGEVLGGVGIADPLDDARGDFARVDVVELAAGYLADVDHDIRTHHRLARNVRLRILFKACIEDGVRYLIGHLVRMPFGDAFRSKNMASGSICHFSFPVDSVVARESTLPRVTD